MFDLNKPVQTRDGRPARIILTDLKSDYPILAIVDHEDSQTPETYTKEGRWVSDHEENEQDLVNVPERTERFVNIYGSGLPGEVSRVTHNTLVEANVAALEARSGVIRLLFEGNSLVAAEVVDQ